jgi:RES domain
MVEAQHLVSTLKLTDTLDEQARLETLLETTKPRVPADCQHLDYLLATPFRYGAAYPKGSRFRRAGPTAGVYYAAEQPQTAVAEIAFYRLLFYAESPLTPLPDAATEYTAIAAALATDAALDLTTPPLAADRAAWTHPTEYAPCQALAETARAAGAAIIRYQSVRDPGQGPNLAVLTCAAFAAPMPVARQTWRIRLHARGVQALCEAPRLRFELSLAHFAADPRLAALAAHD